jgi:hypothetical protein
MSGYPRVAEVVRMVRPEELQQARYYSSLLDGQRAHVEDELAGHCAALAKHQAGHGSRRELLQLREAVRQKRREEFTIDRMVQALNTRFFPANPAPTPVRCFDIEVTAGRRQCSIRIPELNESITAGYRDDLEMAAREQIAVSIGAAISAVAVRVIGESEFVPVHNSG